MGYPGWPESLTVGTRDRHQQRQALVNLTLLGETPSPLRANAPDW